MEHLAPDQGTARDCCVEASSLPGVHAGIIFARNAEIKVADPSLRAMLVEDVTNRFHGRPDAQESDSA